MAKVGSACAGCMAGVADAHDRKMHGAVWSCQVELPWHQHWHDVTFGAHKRFNLPIRVMLLALSLSLVLNNALHAIGTVPVRLVLERSLQRAATA
jgi:hypothetical protein